MKDHKRILAWILSAVMLISSISLFSYAAEDTVQLFEEAETQADESEILVEEVLKDDAVSLTESEAEEINENESEETETEEMPPFAGDLMVSKLSDLDESDTALFTDGEEDVIFAADFRKYTGSQSQLSKDTVITEDYATLTGAPTLTVTTSGAYVGHKAGSLSLYNAGTTAALSEISGPVKIEISAWAQNASYTDLIVKNGANVIETLTIETGSSTENDTKDYVVYCNSAAVNLSLTGQQISLVAFKITPLEPIFTADFRKYTGAQSQLAKDTVITEDYATLTGEPTLTVTTSGAYVGHKAGSLSLYNAGTTAVLSEIANPVKIEISAWAQSSSYTDLVVKSGTDIVETLTIEAGSSTANDTKDYVVYCPYSPNTISISGQQISLVALKVTPYEPDAPPVQWAKKNFGLKINGTTVTVTGAETSGENAQVSLSDGNVVLSRAEDAQIRINLEGNPLAAAMLTDLTGGITADVLGDDVIVTFDDSTTKPYKFTITVKDSGKIIEPEAGKMYAYAFNDKSIFLNDTTIKYDTFSTDDGFVVFDKGEGNPIYWHDGTHGVAVYPRNTIAVKVAGNAEISFVGCAYGNDPEATLDASSATGTITPSTAKFVQSGTDGKPINYTYEGSAGIVTFTLKESAIEKLNVEFYVHGLVITNDAAVEPGNGKIDSWDFGAYQLDAEQYNNRLNETIINSWYSPGITPGSVSSSNLFPSSFTAGALSWVGGNNDRLRSTNTALTRYDENVGVSDGVIGDASNLSGRVYVNASAAQGRYLSITLNEDDELTLYVKTDAGGKLNFVYSDPDKQTDTVDLPVEGTVVKFIAKYAGRYKIFDTVGKPSYYRILRADAKYKTVSGDITVSDELSGYELIFTNKTTNKQFNAVITGNRYTADLPSGYDYKLSLSNANGYIISNGTEITVADDLSKEVVVEKVVLFTVTGGITGLDADSLGNMALEFVPDTEKIYVPEVEMTGDSYTVQLEPDITYNVIATGVNDYEISSGGSVKITESGTNNIVFTPKTTYPVTFNITGLSDEAKDELIFTFTNLDEQEYSYTFKVSDNNTRLRNGTYKVSYDGLSAYQYDMALTSNLVINGSAVVKDIKFNEVYYWNFAELTNDHVANGKFRGLLIESGAAKNGVYLRAPAGGVVKIPVNPDDRIIVGYCYEASFYFDADSENPVTTESKSTSTHEFAEYVYTGTEKGYVTLTAAGQTYFENITVAENVPYKAEISVGSSGDYKTVKEAVDAAAKMNRPNGERVVISIEPGNYEEMLVISTPNITLKNASENPSIELTNKGVDIGDDAVRITSYYGHGYNYYSMGNDVKYDADVLAVNKANGYLSKENPGSGSTDGSYWNATVVITGKGFEAEGIIFENSFNQYISEKEANDVVVMWESGSKGLRSTVAGDTSVQDKSFVERAAAMAILADKALFDNCRFVGRQDTLYGQAGMRVFFNNCAVMGGTDYIFGGMIAVFNKCRLVFNTSEASTDVGYITAAQQSSGRGYLMYNCTVTSTTPGVDTASVEKSKPGYLGRPWAGQTSETVFVNTAVEGRKAEGTSLIMPIGWLDTLGGQAPVYEYNTIELTGENNFASRASWAKILTIPKIGDVDLVPFSFTAGDDGWDPYSDIGELQAPGNLEWNEYIGTWDVVEGADGYIVQMYFNGEAKGDPVVTAENTYDFTSLFSLNGKYVFKVTAISDTGTYENSAASYSAAKGSESEVQSWLEETVAEDAVVFGYKNSATFEYLGTKTDAEIRAMFPTFDDNTVYYYKNQKGYYRKRSADGTFTTITAEDIAKEI